MTIYCIPENTFRVDSDNGKCFPNIDFLLNIRLSQVEEEELKCPFKTLTEDCKPGCRATYKLYEVKYF